MTYTYTHIHNFESMTAITRFSLIVVRYIEDGGVDRESSNSYRARDQPLLQAVTSCDTENMVTNHLTCLPIPRKDYVITDHHIIPPRRRRK